MVKKLLITAVLAALVGALAVALAARNLPDLVVRNLRQTLGREVSIESLRVRFPLRVEMNRLLIAENEPFKGEAAFYVERAVASVDAWTFVTSKKILFTQLELTRPRVIFRKSLGKLYHAFRIRPAGSAAADAASGTAGPARRGVVPPLKFDRVLIRDGEVQFMDYDADRKGFVVTLLRLSADLHDLALPSDGSRLAYTVEALLDQGRDTPAARLKLEGDWIREKLEGRTSLQLTGVSLPYFEPYYRTVTPSRISDGELDIVASAQSPAGILTANSKWTIRRLTFDKSEDGNQLMGFDANLIRNILANDAGNLTLDLVMEMDLRDPSVPFREVLRRSLHRSIRATFAAYFESTVRNTVNQIASGESDLLNKQNWKDLLKKNKIEDVVSQIMNPQ